MKIGNWEITFESYWRSNFLCTFYLMFFTWSESKADYGFCFCNFYICFHNSKKDDKYWKEYSLSEDQIKKVKNWIGDK